MSDAQHIVRSYEQELQRLKTLLTDMGGITESQVALATQGILRRDTEAAGRAVAADSRVDALEHEIEGFVIRMLALRQPMADDLRLIVAALKISADLERIGDYAANVAKRAIVLGRVGQDFNLSGVAHMSELVQRNLKLIVDAIGEGDIAKALEVWRSDQQIDDVYNGIFRALITYMMEDPRSITPCTHLMFIAKNLERIGDKATNIAEILHYAITGEAIQGQRPKGESSANAMPMEEG